MNSLRSHKAILGWLLLAMFALRAIVPIGYMIGEVAKTTTVTLCGGVHHNTNKSPHEPITKAQDDTPCPFNINAVGLSTDWQPPAQIFLSFILISLIAFSVLRLNAQRLYGNASPRAPPR